MSRTIAVVPIRSVSHAKSRLAPLFDAETRSSVTRHLLLHVLNVLRESGSIAETLVISPDPDSLPAQVDRMPRTRLVAQTSLGLNAAIDLGRDHAIAMEFDRLLVVLPDLPLLQPDDVRDMLGESAPVVIARDRHGTGTNTLLLDLADSGAAFAFAFGSGSAARHVAEAERSGLSWGSVDTAGLRHDLDTPEDWAILPADVRVALSSGAGMPMPVACLCE